MVVCGPIMFEKKTQAGEVGAIWLISWGHLVLSDLKKIGPNTKSLSSQGSGFSLNIIAYFRTGYPMTVYKTLWI